MATGDNSIEEPTRIIIILPTFAYFVSGIRDFTLQMVKNMTGFSDQWAFRFQSVVDELCNNAIEFGSAKGQNVKVTFEYTPNVSLDIYVEDSGTGENPLKPEELAKIVKDRQEISTMDKLKTLRGRGLSEIVSNWTDKLEFTKSELGGICVHITKTVDQDQGESRGTTASPKIINL